MPDLALQAGPDLVQRQDGSYAGGIDEAGVGDVEFDHFLDRHLRCKKGGKLDVGTVE